MREDICKCYMQQGFDTPNIQGTPIPQHKKKKPKTIPQIKKKKVRGPK